MDAIITKGLTKQYNGFCLDHLDLTLPGGCILGLIGENGAGKSTTIKLLLNLIRRDSGEVSVLGQDPVDADNQTREDIGVVMDEIGCPASFTPLQLGKVLQNVYRRWDDELFHKLLAQMEVPEKKKFSTLSNGMKKKLGIACAMAHHPKLLFLDEATNGLDPVARDNLLDLLYEFTRKEDHSILISSHIVSDLERLCDYIAFLHKGKLMLCEEKDTLLAEYGICHCTLDQLGQLPQTAVLGKRTSPYGAEILVKKDAIPASLSVGPATIEELFVFMAKEAI